MYKVAPEMQTISTDEIFKLENITQLTMTNNGTYDVKYSYGFGGFRILKEGQSVSYDAGANTVFAETAKIEINFIAPKDLGETDFKSLILDFSRLTASSANLNNILVK